MRSSYPAFRWVRMRESSIDASRRSLRPLELQRFSKRRFQYPIYRKFIGECCGKKYEYSLVSPNDLVQRRLELLRPSSNLPSDHLFFRLDNFAHRSDLREREYSWERRIDPINLKIAVNKIPGEMGEVVVFCPDTTGETGRCRVKYGGRRRIRDVDFVNDHVDLGRDGIMV